MVLRAIGLIATAGLALSACTGPPPDPEASRSPSSDPTPAASASPSPEKPAKPERPEAMKRKDAEGAAAAAEYFIELYPYVMSTGDTEEFEAMSHRACGFCADALEDIAQFQTSGQSYVGGGASGTVLTIYERDDLTGIYPLDLSIEQASSRVIDSTGTEISSASESASEVRVEVGRRDGRWVVVEVASAPEG